MGTHEQEGMGAAVRSESPEDGQFTSRSSAHRLGHVSLSLAIFLACDWLGLARSVVDLVSLG